MDFFYFSVCHVCKKPSPELKKCSSCKVLHYCSREHQMKDWPKHKELCKIITKTNKILICPTGASAEDLNHFKYSSALLWRFELGRELACFEHDMWMFPKVCAVCYSTEVTRVCQTCLNIVYCTKKHEESHQEQHMKYCDGLKLTLVIHQMLLTEQMSPDWIKFKVSRDIRALPESIQELLRLLGFHAEPDFSKKHVDYVMMTEFFSPVSTMLYGLEKSRFIENRRGKKSKLVIHVVGPDDTEYKFCWPVILEFLAHWITNLKSVRVILIGPAVLSDEESIFTFNCDECKAKGFTARMINIEGFYHDLVHFISKPDLVVAFNSGLDEFYNNEKDTWKDSIPKLICFRGVPAILTAYTETELKSDIQRFQEGQVNFLVEPQRNPFGNLRPIRNWEAGSEPIFYMNNYVTVVTRK